jgi:hypothetical protein
VKSIPSLIDHMTDVRTWKMYEHGHLQIGSDHTHQYNEQLHLVKLGGLGTSIDRKRSESCSESEQGLPLAVLFGLRMRPLSIDVLYPRQKGGVCRSLGRAF